MPKHFKKPTVVFHIDERGSVQNYADGDVSVIWVCDMTPEDRLYKTDPDPIPKDMLNGFVGSVFDGSQAMIKLQRVIKEAMGEPIVSEVPRDPR